MQKRRKKQQQQQKKNNNKKNKKKKQKKQQKKKKKQQQQQKTYSLKDACLDNKRHVWWSVNHRILGLKARKHVPSLDLEKKKCWIPLF